MNVGTRRRKITCRQLSVNNVIFGWEKEAHFNNSVCLLDVIGHWVNNMHCLLKNKIVYLHSSFE